jgi:hypothetical protein
MPPSSSLSRSGARALRSAGRCVRAHLLERRRNDKGVPGVGQCGQRGRDGSRDSRGPHRGRSSAERVQRLVSAHPRIQSDAERLSRAAQGASMDRKESESDGHATHLLAMRCTPERVGSCGRAGDGRPRVGRRRHRAQLRAGATCLVSSVRGDTRQSMIESAPRQMREARHGAALFRWKGLNSLTGNPARGTDWWRE